MTVPSIATHQTDPDPKVYFVGAGPGDPDLITVKGQKLLQQATVILYTDSLIPPELLHWAHPQAELIPSADKTLENLVDLIQVRISQGKSVVRLQDGDPSLYGAMQELMSALLAIGIGFEVVPGVSAYQLAAARLQVELTLPNLVQTIILTRISGRTEVPATEELARLAAHQASLCLYLSARHVERVQSQLMQHYPAETPVALCYRLGWSDEQIQVVPLNQLAIASRQANYNRTTLYLISPALKTLTAPGRSRLYHPDHDRLFRP
ncbi:MAG: precorrin-4 C(11)-methyltransferase [Synechococcales bacterium]|nr:precorrin-4 C(11)-methyltransferase [Synechococcales bacterium]